MNKEEAMARLHEVLKPGDTVHTILRHVARSGMYRRISLVKIGKDGDTFQLDHLCEAIGLGKVRDRTEGLGVSGCGMDMGFHLVYELGRRLWPDGTPKPHGQRNGKPDRDGGYALKHRWL